MDALTPVWSALRVLIATMNTDLTPYRSPCLAYISFQPFRLQSPDSSPSSLRYVTGGAVPFFYSLSSFGLARRTVNRQRDRRVSGFAIEPQARRDYLAESSSLSYGLAVRLPLLPTSPHDDAVSVGYRVCNDHSEVDLHHSDYICSQAHDSGLFRLVESSRLHRVLRAKKSE